MLDRTADSKNPRAGSVDSGAPLVRAPWRRFVGRADKRLRYAGAAFLRAGTRTRDFFAGAWTTLRTEGFARALRRVWQFLLAQSFSSLTRRIVILNVAGLLALVLGIIYLNQFRAGLIDARVQSLLVQGDLIAIAIAAQATQDSDAINIDPERLLELKAGESYGPSDDALFGFEFPVSPGARGTAAAPADHAHQYARAHLRPRRFPGRGQPQSLWARRRAAL